MRGGMDTVLLIGLKRQYDIFVVLSTRGMEKIERETKNA
jgi:hypothetical protein